MNSLMTMRGFLFSVMLAIAATGVSGHIACAAPGDPPVEIGGMPFAKFINSQFYFTELAREVLAYEAGVGPCTGSDNVSRVQMGRPQIAMEFPKLGFPPQWMEVVQVSGCEPIHDRAVLVLYVDRRLIYLPLIGGSGLSRFDAVLQRDVIGALVAAERVHAQRAGCALRDHIGIVTTKVIARVEKADGLYWEEIWTIANCRGEKELTVGFAPSSSGGTDFTIRQPEKK